MHRIHPDIPPLPIRIDHGVTLDELIARLQAYRGKPLHIHELEELGQSNSLCGLWLATDDADIVLHAPSDSALHREQFILHELSHMLLQHDRADEKSGYVTATVLPGYEAATVVKALARDGMDDQFELEAERLADIIATFMRRRPQSKFSEVFG
jgi:hypothetical protein